VSGPVERAEKRPRRQGGIGRGQRAAARSLRHESADAALVAIAFGDDGRAQAFGQRVELEMRGRTLQLVDQAEDVGRGERPEPFGERRARAPGRREVRQQAIQRAVLTEVEQLVLALEVVIQVAGGEVCGDGDVAHAGGRKAAVAEDARGGAQDVDAARVGPA
jgi:hypothetical protein